MSNVFRLLPLLGFLTLLPACGQVAESTLASTETQDEKTPCPGNHDGFYVCLANQSTISDSDLFTVIQQSLTQLVSLVNTSDFQRDVASSYTNGDDIVAHLEATDYIVKIEGYCDAASSELAKADVGGYQIYYNECRVQKDDNGNPVLAHVAGVLLHEISHNIGYTHPDENPSVTTIPYFLGNLAEAKLGGSGHTDSSVDRPQVSRRRR